MSINKFIIVVITFSILGCSENVEKKNTLPVHKKTLSLKIEPTSLNENVLGIIYLKQMDSLTIASTFQEEHLYWVLEDEKVMANFGNIGKGPKEIAYPIHIYDTFKRNAFLYDSQLLQLSEIDIDKSMKSGKLEIVNQFEFPKELSGARDVFYINDKLITGIYDDNFSKRLNEKRGVFFYYQKSGTYELLELNNIDLDPYEAMPATNINAKMPTLSPDRKRLAIASVHNPILEIVDLERKKVKEFKLEGKEVIENYRLEDFKDGEATQYFTFAYSTVDHIYLLYKGYSENNTEEKPDFIKIYTWDGDPVGKYEIPFGYAISSFYLNEEKGELTGHSLENGKTFNFELR